MDIAKYIGLFLLKNHFCYIHGLGNMELHKRPAVHNGKELQAPTYDVIVTPGGSIDDNLANFIATNEQISISKAANALRDFSIQARTDMAAGKEVAITNIGKFTEQNGKIKFVTDDNFRFTPTGIPVIKNSKQLEEQIAKPAHKPSYPPPQKADSINWSMVILAVVLLIVLGGGAYGIYYYTTANKEAAAAAAIVKKDTVITPQQQPLTAPVDTTKRDTLAAIAPPVDSMAKTTYRMVIGNYRTQDRADRRVVTLMTNGNKVEILKKDSTNFFILTTIHCRAQDTMHVEDSLKRMFGYKDVVIYK